MNVRNFLDISSFSKEQISSIVNLALDIKANKQKYSKALSGKVLSALFYKPSFRTRISFDLAINNLGGRIITFNQTDIHPKEEVKDLAVQLSKMTDFVAIRCFEHSLLTEFAKYSSVPVINALSNFSHPCQAMAAALTFIEKIGDLRGKKIAWIGDGNNVLTSYVQLCSKIDFDLAISTPKGFMPNVSEFEQCKSLGGKISFFDNPKDAVKNADVIVTDTWVSMGDANGDEKKKAFVDFQVNSSLMGYAKPSCLFSHCLPAYRGFEVTEDVIDGKNSVVFDEAENRIYIQEAILLFLNQSC